MRNAAITGWGKCMPPAVLSNDDLATFLDTDDAWITQRTGIRERRVTHVLGSELAQVAGARALACAGLDAKDLDAAGVPRGPAWGTLLREAETERLDGRHATREDALAWLARRARTVRPGAQDGGNTRRNAKDRG